MTRNQTIFVFVLILVVAGLASCAGMNLGDIVQVRTPNSVQQTTGLPSRTSLNEAVVEYQAWFEDVQRTGAQWKGNIERANEMRGMLSQLTLAALDDLGPTLAGVPMLGPLLPAATGLIGLFLGVGRLRQEKEASFNKGLEEGRKAMILPDVET
jgi:hypothetical protein